VVDAPAVPGAAGEGWEEALAASALASDAAVEDGVARHLGESIEDFDPVLEVVEKNTRKALLRLNYHDDPEALWKALALEVMPHHKVLVLVDAQTSKHKIGCSLVKMAATIMARGGAGGPRRS